MDIDRPVNRQSCLDTEPLPQWCSICCQFACCCFCFEVHLSMAKARFHVHLLLPTAVSTAIFGFWVKKKGWIPLHIAVCIKIVQEFLLVLLWCFGLIKRLINVLNGVNKRWQNLTRILVTLRIQRALLQPVHLPHLRHLCLFYCITLCSWSRW